MHLVPQDVVYQIDPAQEVITKANIKVSFLHLMTTFFNVLILSAVMQHFCLPSI